MNIVNFIEEHALEFGGRTAIVDKTRTSVLGLKKTSIAKMSFDELLKRINVYGNAFIDAGISSNDKVLVFVTPGLEFPVIVYALFKIGAVPVFIDPGMGQEFLLECVEKVHAKALIGMSKIFYLKGLRRRYFSSIEISINIDGSLFGNFSLSKIVKNVSNKLQAVEKQGHELSAILFTSGGTGTPKGVEYTSEMLISQTLRFKEMFRLGPRDNDYPGFGPFSLFTLALGLTSFVTQVDASRPATSSPKKVMRDLIEKKITFASGSPSIWQNVADYCLRKKIIVPELNVLAMFGAPVRHELLAKLEKVFVQADIYTPYGATESLPVSLISSREVLEETKSKTDLGLGVCVGFPVRGVNVKIVDEFKNEVALGEKGEIAVFSPTTTPGYHLDLEATQKIRCENFHLMGDMGHLDKWGRIWFLGRKAHTLYCQDKVYYPMAIEAIFNLHAQVSQCALVLVNEKPAIAIQRVDKKVSLSINFRESFFSELELLSKKFFPNLELNEFYLQENFPVDTRHNIKIDRLKLGKDLSH
jgi:acyl-CoA synthetase (AMP-forming)/AMP-acid ligase II